MHSVIGAGRCVRLVGECGREVGPRLVVPELLASRAVNNTPKATEGASPKQVNLESQSWPTAHQDALLSDSHQLQGQLTLTTPHLGHSLDTWYLCPAAARFDALLAPNYKHSRVVGLVGNTGRRNHLYLC